MSCDLQQFMSMWGVGNQGHHGHGGGGGGGGREGGRTQVYYQQRSREKPYVPFEKSMAVIIFEQLRAAQAQKVHQLNEIEDRQNEFSAHLKHRKQALMMSHKERITEDLSAQSVNKMRGLTIADRVEREDLYPQFDEQQEMFGLELGFGNSVKSMKKRYQRNIKEFLSRINNYKVEGKEKYDTIKMLMKNKFEQRWGEISREAARQHKKIKEMRNPNKLDDFLNLFDTNLLKQAEKLQREIDQFIRKCEEVVDLAKYKSAAPLEQREEKMKKMERDYFDYTRTKLIKVSIQQRIPPFEGMKIDPFKNQKPPRILQMIDFSRDEFSSKYNIMFNEKSFSGLNGTGWLHNSVIDNYIAYLRETRRYNHHTSPCAIFTSSESNEFLNAETYKFTHQIFTKFERVGMTINSKGDHWFFIGVFPKLTKIVIYDSINKASTNYTQYCQKIRKFVMSEEAYFKIPHTFDYSQTDEGTTPAQTNGSDCGVHVLRNLTHFLDNNFKEDCKIIFKTSQNNQIRMAFYHFMVYLISIFRNNDKAVRYDWLEYSSRSAIIKPRMNILWRDPR